jgi:hypothetical protein
MGKIETTLTWDESKEENVPILLHIAQAWVGQRKLLKVCMSLGTLSAMEHI